MGGASQTDLPPATPTHHVCLLEMPYQSSPALELLPTDLTVELWRIGLEATHIMILHPIDSGALEFTFLQENTHTLFLKGAEVFWLLVNRPIQNLDFEWGHCGFFFCDKTSRAESSGLALNHQL